VWQAALNISLIEPGLLQLHFRLRRLCRLKGICSHKRRLDRTFTAFRALLPREDGYALLCVNLPLLLDFAFRNQYTAVHQKIRDCTVRGERPEAPRLLVEARAALVQALMKTGRMKMLAPGSERIQRWVTDLIVECECEELLLLKNLLDSRGNYHNLYKLVYHDVADPELQREILEHIRASCEQRSGGPGGPGQQLLQARKSGPLKILSDIDDTLVCSGGSWPSGTDSRFPKGTLYPGILPLFQELDSYHMQQVEEVGRHESYFCNVCFISARPHIWKDLTETVSYRLFRALKEYDVLHAMPTLIPGTHHTSARSVVASLFGQPGAWVPAGRAKFDAVEKYSRLYPESELVFFGDNGQGDAWVAEKALSCKPPLIHTAFILEVQTIETTITSLQSLTLEERKREWASMGLVFVRSAVQAAVRAAQQRLPDGRPLLGVEQLGRVCRRAAVDLVSCVQIHHSKQGFKWRALVDAHNEDVREAKRVIEELGGHAALEKVLEAGDSEIDLQKLELACVDSNWNAMSEPFN